MEKNEINENELTENETLLSGETNEKNSVGRLISANVLDQLIMIAFSGVLLFIIDFIMRKAFGYMFIRDNGALILAGGILYFIANCIYMPIMQKTKLENTVAKKILNLN